MAYAPGEIADIASSTSAGVFVMTRTTGVPSGSHLAKNPVGRPAQSVTISFPEPGSIIGPSSSISVDASCGLTLMARTSAAVTAVAVSTTRMP